MVFTIEEKKIKKAIAGKKWAAENKDKVKLSGKKWRAENKDYYKQYFLDNPRSCKIADWKRKGLITPDYNIIYDRYANSTNCEQCNHDYSYYIKHMDHEHINNVIDNFRAILCHKCNVNSCENNTSGYPNINKTVTGWAYDVTYKKVRHRKQLKTKEDAIAYKTHYELTLFD